MTEEIKIRGWMARDGDGELIFYSVKPERSERDDFWFVPGACLIFEMGYRGEFDSLKWEDEPREVELVIRESK